jgi:hypothetical protein
LTQLHLLISKKESSMNSKESFASIAALDLDPIKVKLMHEESGEGWSREYADAVEFEYRRFLYLVKQFPNEQTAPLFDVDVFWHYHILDTMKYAVDCEAVFGYFLHHFPYVGLRGEEDLQAHHRVGERMRELYEQTYGEQYIRQEIPANAAAGGKVAFSSPATAFSSPTGKIAFSSPAAFAFSSPTAQFAFSSPAAKFAFSSPAAKFAFSSPAAALDSPDAIATGSSDASGRAAAAQFYSVRPTLTPAM